LIDEMAALRRRGPLDAQSDAVDAAGGWMRTGGGVERESSPPRAQPASPTYPPYASLYGSPATGSPVESDLPQHQLDAAAAFNAKLPGYRGRNSDPEDSASRALGREQNPPMDQFLSSNPPSGLWRSPSERPGKRPGETGMFVVGTFFFALLIFGAVYGLCDNEVGHHH